MLKKRTGFFMLLLLMIFFVYSFALSESQITEVVIEEDAITIDLAVSASHTLNAYGIFEGADHPLTWSSSSKSTLSVEHGILTAHKTGRVTVTASLAQNGNVKDQCVVTIIDSGVPTGISITTEYEFLEPTMSMQLTANVEPALASQDVKWYSYDTSVATIDQNGVVTAKRTGSVYIQAASRVNKNVSTTIKLYIRYAKAPDKISVPVNDMTLYVGDAWQISPVIEPNDASRIIDYSSSNSSVASVSKDGTITALSYGTCTITVKSAANSKASEKISVRVLDERIPELLVAYPSYLNLAPSNIRDVSLLILPEDMKAELIWTSTNDNVASVDQDGRITALSEGECTIICTSAYTDAVSAKIPVSVKYGKTIRSLKLSVSEITIPRGETASVTIEKTPADAGNAIACTYSNPGICEMDESGTITALRRGETVVTLYSYKDPEISQNIKVIVVDDLSPLSAVSSVSLKPVLRPGDTVRPEISFLPENAVQTYTWTCSHPEIAYVDDEGVITAISPGVSIITAVNTHANEIALKFVVTVESDDYTLVMPERRTDKAELEDNLQKIENVRLSAQKMLLKEYEAGKMPKEEFERRSEVIDEAFEMYAFPWMITKVQKYWNDANSENGAKDFKPGIMYYGMPYVSGGNSNRTFNARKAVELGRYVPAEDGDYYIFNHDSELYDGMYVGNDCSAFVSLAYFGHTNYNGDTVKTYTLYYDNRFTTTDDPENLLAGDILVRHSIHVIMFLYWADEAHTQAVFIEQGGSEDAINTVSTSVYTVSDYLENHYHIRSPFYR